MTDIPQSSKTWSQIASEAQAHRNAVIDSVFAKSSPSLPDPLPRDVSGLPNQFLSAEELDITISTAEILLQHLASAKLTCVQVASAFLKRAALAQKLVSQSVSALLSTNGLSFTRFVSTDITVAQTNCLTELLPDRALERARSLDAHLQQHGTPIGPLHGLPISVKEHILMKGLNADSSFVGLYGTLADDDALILKILWQAGAVFYARTTEPQTIMHLETASNLYGTTLNPFNRTLTAGGSSGGEGALLGLQGSCLGLGTDIGGSIRSPAANNGLFGLRPTAGRLPYAGIGGCGGGMEQILGVVGPLSTSLEGIKILMRAVLAAKPWLTDPSLVPIPWTPFVQPESLRVAVMWDDGVVRPHPPVQRALREVVEKLKNAPGVSVVEWVPWRHDYAWEIIAELFFPDGGAEELDCAAIADEPLLPLTRWILTENPHCREMSVPEVWHATERREAYRAEYARLWNQTATKFDGAMPLDAVDVILCPAGPGAAPKLETARYWGYTSQWNLLDYPALVFPVTKVDLELDKREDDYVPRNESDKYNHELYDGPEAFENAPVGLQLVGRRFEEEKVVGVLERIMEFL